MARSMRTRPLRLRREPGGSGVEAHAWRDGERAIERPPVGQLSRLDQLAEVERVNGRALAARSRDDGTVERDFHDDVVALRERARASEEDVAEEIGRAHV